MFRIHRSERADALVEGLVEVLVDAPADPFTAEVVAVPTRGVERWLTHRIGSAVGSSTGRGDGVCANIDFPFPGRLVGDVLAESTDVGHDQDPWRPERLVWPVLAALDEHAGDGWLGLVGRHLGSAGATTDPGDSRRDRRYATARHIAQLYDRYAIYRPSLVLDWLDRDDRADADDPALRPDCRWQPALLRIVHDMVGAPSPPERMATACERLRNGEIPALVPDRVSLFGLTRLPASYLEVLRALAAHRDVHLFALHPSLALWDRIAALDLDPVGLRRSEDRTRRLPTNPLLATWGHDSREMQVVLAAAAEADVAHRPPPGTGRPTTLLGRIQADVRDDVAPAPPGEPPRHVVDREDRSIQVHACHGRARQVEVLRDAICHLLADDVSLEPRDVIVLCPDIDEFAPLLHSTFGARTDPRDAGGGPPSVDRTGLPHLPYRLADRSLRQTNPLLGALADLLDLVDSRLSATDVFRFAGRPPVRRRFGLDDEALERLTGWAEDSGVRWGLDAAHRRPWDLHSVPDHTWRAGLDRILLGVTMDTDDARLVGDRLPLDDVDSGDVDLAGRLAELVDRLGTVVTELGGTHDLAGWIERLDRATDLLFAAPAAEPWQRIQVDGLLREVLGEARTDAAPSGSGAEASNAPGPVLSLADVRTLLADRLRGVPTRADFRTGAITMCTLVPMRAVPHRVVCLLGLDDGSFPRAARADGDDLLAERPLVGDRDPRTEDRQLLLDAVLSATEHLVITYAGHDVRTNEVQPPAVPLHELLAVIDRTATTSDGRPATTQVVREHPLQPFDPRGFEHGSPWSFDLVQLAGARAVHGQRHPAPGFLDGPLDSHDDDVVLLDELVRFVQDPIREFLRQRLGLQTWERDDDVADTIPVELDGLGAWQVGAHILDRLQAGIDLDRAVRAEIGAGVLPPGDMRLGTLRNAARAAAAIHQLAVDNGVSGRSRSVEIDVEVPVSGGTARVVGTVPGVHDDLVTDVSFSRLRPKTRLLLWTRLLAVTATEPDRPWSSVGIGKHRQGGRIVRHRAVDAGVGSASAAVLLGRLVDLRRRGVCEPLPLPCATAEAWASKAVASGPGAVAAADDAAERAWTTGYDAEMSDASVVRVFGDGFTYDRLAGIAATAAESGDDWTEGPSRFGRLALRIWAPLLDREQWR